MIRRVAASSASDRVITRAENMEASTPTVRVTPNPRTGPEARKNSSPAASRVVTLESAMADSARRNPVVTALRSDRPRSANSSRERS